MVHGAGPQDVEVVVAYLMVVQLVRSQLSPTISRTIVGCDYD